MLNSILHSNKTRFLQNKKAGEKYLSIWWFFAMAFAAGGIVVGVMAVTLGETSVKKVESDILVNRFVNCVIKDGNVVKEFLEGNFDVLEKCYLNKEMIKESSKYFIQAEIYEFDNCRLEGEIRCGKLVKNVYYGDLSFKENCKIAESLKATKKFPECSDKYVYALNGAQELLIHFSAGSNQIGGGGDMIINNKKAGLLCNKRAQIGSTLTWIIAFIVIFFIIIIFTSLSISISIGRSVPAVVKYVPVLGNRIPASGIGQSEIAIESGKVFDVASMNMLNSILETKIENDRILDLIIKDDISSNEKIKTAVGKRLEVFKSCNYFFYAKGKNIDVIEFNGAIKEQTSKIFLNDKEAGFFVKC